MDMRTRKTFRMWWRDFWHEVIENARFVANPTGCMVLMILDAVERSQKPRIYLASDNGEESHIE